MHGVFYNLGAAILMDMLFITLFFMVPLTETIRRIRNNNAYGYGSTNVNKMKIMVSWATIAVLIAVHLRFYYLAILTDEHPFLWHMVRSLLVEIFLGLIGLLAFGLYRLCTRIRSYLAQSFLLRPRAATN